MPKKAHGEQPPAIKLTAKDLDQAGEYLGAMRPEKQAEALTIAQQIVAHLDTQLAGLVEELDQQRERLVCVEAAQVLARRSVADPVAALETVERLLDQLEQLGELAKAHGKQSRELAGLASSIRFSVETLHADVMRRGRDEKKRLAKREASTQAELFAGGGGVQ
jgi:hypothetical protein